MKRIVMTFALTAAFSVSVLAGEIPTVGIAPPPPPGTTQSSTATSPGDIPSSGFAQQLSDDAAMAVLLTILGLLA